MNSIEHMALQITRDIVVAKMSNNTGSVSAESGIKTGEYFKEIYKAVNEIASSSKEQS